MQRAWSSLATSRVTSSASSLRLKNSRLFTHRQALHTTASRNAVTQFLMPAMSPTMTEGAITKWKVKEGDSFLAGDVLVEIETDKAQIDVEAQDDGYLAKILSPAGGSKIAVNDVIALLAEEGDTLTKEDLDVAPKRSSETATLAEAQQTSKAPTAKPAPSVPERNMKKGEMVYFPSVARLIAVNDLDPTAIQGTGPKGRLLKGDVLKVIKQGGGVKAPSKSASKPLANQANARPMITHQTNNAKLTVPRFVLQREIPLGSGTGTNRIPQFIQAASQALRATPHLNIQYAKNPHYSAEEIHDVSLATEYLMSKSNTDKTNGTSSVEISLRANGSAKRVVYKNADQVQPEPKAEITMELLNQSMVKTNDEDAKAVGFFTTTSAVTYDRSFFDSAMEPTYINVAETGEKSDKETYTDLIDYFGGRTMPKHETKHAVPSTTCPFKKTEDTVIGNFLDGIASPMVKKDVFVAKTEPEACTVSFSFDYRLVDPVVAEEFVDMVEKYAQSAGRDKSAA